MTQSATIVKGYGAMQLGGNIQPWSFERRAPRSNDVAVEILYCGVCHSDLHAVRGKGWTREFPLVPGHEIIGRVTAVGESVSRFKTGDTVAIGTIVDSCQSCEPCRQYLESYCYQYPTTTYGGIDRVDGTTTRGGYSECYVAHEDFVYALPSALDPSRAAPLLCAGITTYSPLRHWQIGPGKTVGILGIGGLGHMAIQFARALGAEVVAFTTSPHKRQGAIELGAHEAFLSTDAQAVASQVRRFDFLLDTISAPYAMDSFVRALKLDGTFCTLGLRGELSIQPVSLALARRRVASSGVGGTRETAEMLEFCTRHGISPMVEMIAPREINSAFDRLEKGNVKYRFVIDMKRP